MDQEAHYWVWMKRRQVLMNSIKDTWEERAFKEDASGQLGGRGCIWPPRSYSCSFCRREFRSAQALGGHMNVHRRDRARLKQSLGRYSDPSNPQPHHNSLKPSTLEPHIFSPETCTLGCDLDLTSSGSLSSSRVSALSTQESLNDHHTGIASPLSSSSFPKAQDHQKGCPNSNPESEKISPPRGEVLIITSNKSKISTTVADLFTGLNYSACCQDPATWSSDNHEAISTNCKRFKASTVSTLSSLLVSNDRCSLQLGHNYSTSSLDDIDLELRLGEAPKVK